MRVGRGAQCVTLSLVLCALIGCGGVDPDSYDAQIFYPTRTDLLVLDLSQVAPPSGPHSPGQLNASIDQLAARGGVLVAPSRLSDEQQKSLASILDEMFGKPSAPLIEHPGAAAHDLTPSNLASGSRVYKRHCVQCHGLTGDGRGPTSLWVYPPARDFRQGQFKFVGTPTGQGWPSLTDLHRAVNRGIGGNSMPPFAMMNDANSAAAGRYTLHLMFRGLVEFDLIRLTDPDDTPTMMKETAVKSLNTHFTLWDEAQKSELQLKSPPITEPRDAANDANYSEQVRRGHELFLSPRSACTTCHVDYGRSSPWRYDVWGVAVKPPNLTQGNYKAGSEAADLFRRIRCGIVGVKMPAAIQLSNDEIWQIVTFLKALPDPRHLPADVRRTVYPEVQ